MNLSLDSNYRQFLSSFYEMNELSYKIIYI